MGVLSCSMFSAYDLWLIRNAVLVHCVRRNILLHVSHFKKRKIYIKNNLKIAFTDENSFATYFLNPWAGFNLLPLYFKQDDGFK